MSGKYACVIDHFVIHVEVSGEAGDLKPLMPTVFLALLRKIRVIILSMTNWRWHIFIPLMLLTQDFEPAVDHCHWLKGLRQCQIAVSIQGTYTTHLTLEFYGEISDRGVQIG